VGRVLGIGLRVVTGADSGAGADSGSAPVDAETGSPAVEAAREVLARLGPLAVVAVALTLGWTTLLPGLAFWDTAEFQSVPPLLGTLHATGFPAYTVLGWLASVVLGPLGDPAFAMNLFSALCVAAAVGLTAVLVRQLTSRPVLAIAAGLVLFLTEITWRISTHADAHSLNLALLALLLVLLVGWESRTRAEGGRRAGTERWLIAAAATYAVAVANHSLAVLVAPGIVLFVFAVDRRILRRTGLVARCLGTFAAIVVAFYLELPLRAGPFRAPLVYGHPETWDGFWYVVLAQQFTGAFGSPFADLGTKFHGLVDLAAAQLGPVAALVPVGFVATIVRRPRYALLTVPTFGLTCFFSMSYSNADIERYYLGPLLIGITWIAIFADALVEALGRVVGSLAEEAPAAIARRTFALEVFLALILAAPAVGASDTVARAVDEHTDTTASTWVDGVLAELAPNAVVLSWWSYSTALWYARDVEGRRTDVTVIDDRTILDENLGDVATVIDEYLGHRPVYVIRLPDDEAVLAERYELQPIPDTTGSGIALVVGRRAAVSP
jgi:hypothetical protein